MTHHLYTPRYRPPMPHTMPPIPWKLVAQWSAAVGPCRSDIPTCDYRFGVVEFVRALTDDERATWELDQVSFPLQVGTLEGGPDPIFDHYRRCQERGAKVQEALRLLREAGMGGRVLRDVEEFASRVANTRRLTMPELKDDGGPAFPVTGELIYTQDGRAPNPGDLRSLSGMTLLDWFAGAALRGMSNRAIEIPGCRHVIAEACYAMADEMLIERARRAALKGGP